MTRRYYDFWYTPSTPKAVKGGIKAQNQRGAFGKKWWSKRWINVLESFNIGARLTRGRSYARKGQVVRLSITSGIVTAKVQGSQSGAYRVTIRLNTFTPDQWEKIIAALVEKPIFAASLLGNTMPETIETVFESARLSLFPGHLNDLDTTCSCPDWSNPCKHIAAVYYLMAEAFDNDPFLIFKLRGMEREDFLTRLGSRHQSKTSDLQEKAFYQPAPLSAEPPERFWKCPVEIHTVVTMSPPPTLHAALPKRLGNLPFWRSGEDFLNVMEHIYRQTSQYAIRRLSEIDL